MRTITIPPEIVDRLVHGPFHGTHLEFAVAVNWPELRLTEAQIIANAIASAAGEREPFPDHSIFSVALPYRPAHLTAPAQQERGQ